LRRSAAEEGQGEGGAHAAEGEVGHGAEHCMASLTPR
jgi:hypothetical protein